MAGSKENAPIVVRVLQSKRTNRKLTVRERQTERKNLLCKVGTWSYEAEKFHVLLPAIWSARKAGGINLVSI